ncbi:MAG: hypothetical protein V7K56_13890 [Nostoc sp.]
MRLRSLPDRPKYLKPTEPLITKQPAVVSLMPSKEIALAGKPIPMNYLLMMYDQANPLPVNLGIFN